MGRIWCPDYVDTEGFSVHFVRAMQWPVDVILGSEDSGTDFAASKRETASDLRPLAQQGDAVAQFKLGVLYKDGRGVGTNYEESAKWFRLAAEQGDIDAQNSLAFAYAKGRGVRQNYIEAYKWANLAHARGVEKLLVQRHEIVDFMSEADIAKAERLARAWEPKSADAAARQVREETERADISEVQKLLGGLGYRIGDADGVAGARTQAAIRAFQFDQGMQTSGTISRELLARLRNRALEKQAK